jgi:tetratricopeptide (TPR) repeat protein
VSYYDLLGEYNLENGLTDKAALCFSGVSAYDDSGKWDATLAYIYHAKGMINEALEYYKKAAVKGAATAGLYVNMGAIQLAEGQIEQAKVSYLTATSMSPDNIQAHYNLAVLYWKIANWRDAAEELKKVTELDPTNQQAKVYLAQAMRRNKQQ